MKSKRELDQVQENSLTSNPAGRSADRELGDKGGMNESAEAHQQTAIDKKRKVEKNGIH